MGVSLVSVAPAVRLGQGGGFELAFVDEGGVEQRRPFMDCLGVLFECGRPGAGVPLGEGSAA